nr:MAG TPA: hypothetical protein [Caudoviricetes sp.]
MTGAIVEASLAVGKSVADLVRASGKIGRLRIDKITAPR